MTYRRGREVGERWLKEEGLEEALESYAGHAASERADSLPALHLEDVSAIPFVNVISGVEQYQHRARVRASDGDLFAAVTPIPEGYEEYCRDELGLGSPALVAADPVESPMAVTRACSVGPAFDQVVSWAGAHERVALHPYMSIAAVWDLAEKLQAESGARVEVIGPPPPTLWLANDKWSLHQIIGEVCGTEWLAETLGARDEEEMVDALESFRGRFERVGLKRTRCASAMGNRVYRSEELDQSREGLRSLVQTFGFDTEWDGTEEILVVEWVKAVASPSTQVWIPARGGGDPIVEGVYEQILEGAEQVFVGSRPSTLPAHVNAAIEEASAAVSATFQELGYTGRCSFDFVVAGDLDDPEVDAYFTECNGRWGGTSTPMRLVDRLMGAPRPDYVAQDWQHEELEGMTFRELHAALEEDLWTPGRRDGRFILYNVGPLEADGKFDIISLGETPEQAWEGVADILPKRLLGR